MLAMRPLEFVNDPKFSGVFFRRKYGELTGAGGLWDKSKKMYPEFKAITLMRWIRRDILGECLVKIK